MEILIKTIKIFLPLIILALIQYALTSATVLAEDFSQLCILCEGKDLSCKSTCQGVLIDDKVITSHHCLLRLSTSYQKNAFFKCGSSKSKYSYFLINKILKFSHRNSIAEYSTYNEFQENDLAAVQVKPAYHYRQVDPRYSSQKIQLFDFNHSATVNKFWGAINKQFNPPDYFRQDFRQIKEVKRLRDGKSKIYELKKDSVAKAHLIRANVMCYSTKNLYKSRQHQAFTQLYAFSQKHHWAVLYKNGETYASELENILSASPQLFDHGYLALPYFPSETILSFSDSGGSFICSSDHKNFFLLGVASTSAPTWTMTGHQFNGWFKQRQTSIDLIKTIAFQTKIKNPYSTSLNYNLENIRKLKNSLIHFNRYYGSLNCQFPDEDFASIQCEETFKLNMTNQSYDLTPQAQIKVYSADKNSQMQVTDNLNQSFLLSCESMPKPVTIKNNIQAFLTICQLKNNLF